MGRQRLAGLLALAAVVAAGAVAIAIAGLKSGDGRASTEPAQLALRHTAPERALIKRLRRHYGDVTNAPCRRARSRSAGVRRYRCRWRARRRLAGNRTLACRGRHVLRRSQRGWRFRRSGRVHCRRRVAAVDPQFGFNDNAVRAGIVSAKKDALLTARVGAGIHRLAFDWRWAEAQPGQYQLRNYDEIYRAMLARGIRPLFILVFAPYWTWDRSVSCNQFKQDCRYPPSREHFDAWRRIAALIATRYPRAAGIEIWNEPNERTFWQPGPDPIRYTELLREAYTAVKAANPRMPVITAGFTNRATDSEGSLSLESFLKAIFGAGARGHFDGIAVHPYTDSRIAAGIDRALGIVRAIRNAAGARRAPLWVTETGFTTTGPQPPRVDEREQARLLIDTYRALKRRRDVRVVIFHTLIDPGADPSSPESGYGIVRRDFSPKPAYCALARELRTGYRC